MAKAVTNRFATSDLELVTYLTLRGILPVDRNLNEERAVLLYERDGALEESVVEFSNRCPTCNIQWSEISGARAEAKRMLLDGEIRKPRTESREPGRR